jgi:lipid II:glycine glycyltransferase (peptidoglycan interpeptide bridge formation enzyme)
MASIFSNPPYFLQTDKWADFWLSAHGTNHFYERIEYSTADISISAYVYIYPWQLTQNFAYLPKGPLLIQLQKTTKPQLLKALRDFWLKVIEFAKTKHCTFIKADFDDEFTDFLGIDSNDDIIEMLETTFAPNGQVNFPKIEVVKDTKTIQFLQTMCCKGANLSIPKGEYELNTLLDWYVENQEFWSQTNQNIRRYTKKSLTNTKFTITGEKSDEQFEKFWQVYDQTAKRQKFATHSKGYFKLLYSKPEAHIITIKLEDEVVCVWFGYSFDNTLIYLYGGNTDKGLSSNAQYLMHVAALALMKRSNLNNYDLGGYDKEKGFGKFKEGYRGEIRTFLGPVDIVLESRKYHFTQRFIKTAKDITSLTNWWR